MTRSRSRTTNVPGGSYAAIGSSTYAPQGAQLGTDETVTDEVLPGDGWPFTVTRLWLSGGEVTKTYGGSNSRRYRDYRATYFRGGQGRPGSYPNLGLPSDGSAATTAVARTNPSRPTVDLPVFLGELRDLPRLFKNHGDLLIDKGFWKALKVSKRYKVRRPVSRAADAYLNYTFGWDPLIGDIGKFLTFTSYVDKRVQELEKLFSRGLKRRIDIASASVSSKLANETLQSLGVTINVPLYHEASEEVSAFLRWFPKNILATPGNAEIRRLAWRATLGLTIDLKTMWELMPWSWMIDYATTVGDYLAAHRNTVPARPGPVQVMRHKRAQITTERWSNSSGAFCTPWKAIRETKSRVVSQPSLEAYLPFISGRQLSILGSIAFLRRNG